MIDTGVFQAKLKELILDWEGATEDLRLLRVDPTALNSRRELELKQLIRTVEDRTRILIENSPMQVALLLSSRVTL